MNRHRKPQFRNAREDQPAGGIEKDTASRRGGRLALVALLGLLSGGTVWFLSDSHVGGRGAAWGEPDRCVEAGAPASPKARRSEAAKASPSKPAAQPAPAPIPCDTPYTGQGEHVTALRAVSHTKVMPCRYRFEVASERSDMGNEERSDAGSVSGVGEGTDGNKVGEEVAEGARTFYRFWSQDKRTGVWHAHGAWSPEAEAVLTFKPGEHDVVAEATTDPQKGAQRSHKVAALAVDPQPVRILSVTVTKLAPDKELIPPQGKARHWLTNDDRVTVSASYTPASATIAINGAPAAGGSRVVNLSEGKNKIDIFAEDAESGGTDSRLIDVAMDTSAPWVQFQAPYKPTTMDLLCLVLGPSDIEKVTGAPGEEPQALRNVFSYSTFKPKARIVDEFSEPLSAKIMVTEIDLSAGTAGIFHEFDPALTEVEDTTGTLVASKTHETLFTQDGALAKVLEYPNVLADGLSEWQAGRNMAEVVDRYGNGPVDISDPDSLDLSIWPLDRDFIPQYSKAYTLYLEVKDALQNKRLLRCFSFVVDRTAPAQRAIRVFSPLISVNSDNDAYIVKQTVGQEQIRLRRETYAEWNKNSVWRLENPLPFPGTGASLLVNNLYVEDIAGNISSGSFTANRIETGVSVGNFEDFGQKRPRAGDSWLLREWRNDEEEGFITGSAYTLQVPAGWEGKSIGLYPDPPPVAEDDPWHQHKIKDSYTATGWDESWEDDENNEWALWRKITVHKPNGVFDRSNPVRLLLPREDEMWWRDGMIPGRVYDFFVPRVDGLSNKNVFERAGINALNVRLDGWHPDPLLIQPAEYFRHLDHIVDYFDEYPDVEPPNRPNLHPDFVFFEERIYVWHDIDPFLASWDNRLTDNLDQLSSNNYYPQSGNPFKVRLAGIPRNWREGWSGFQYSIHQFPVAEHPEFDPTEDPPYPHSNPSVVGGGHNWPGAIHDHLNLLRVEPSLVQSGLKHDLFVMGAELPEPGETLTLNTIKFKLDGADRTAYGGGATTPAQTPDKIFVHAATGVHHNFTWGDDHVRAVAGGLQQKLKLVVTIGPDVPAGLYDIELPGPAGTPAIVLEKAINVFRFGVLADATHDGQIDGADVIAQFCRPGAVFVSGFPAIAGHPVMPASNQRIRVKLDVSIDPDEAPFNQGELKLLTDNDKVKIFTAATGGTHLATEEDRTWSLPGEAASVPGDVYLEFPADDEAGLTLYFERTDDEIPFFQARFLRVTRLSNGLGAADGIAPSVGAVPGLASASLASGNLHLGETVRAYHTPALGPNVSVSYDSMEGLKTGLGRGWRTNYDLRLFDTSVDLNRDGAFEFDERQENDLLVLVLGDGSRAVFQYQTALKRFVADPQSRIPGAQIGVDPIGPDPVIPANWFEAFDPDGERGFAYVLNLNANLLFYFNADGRLVRIENMQKKGLSVVRNPQGHAVRVEDDYGRFEDLRAASFGTGGEYPGTIAGRQAHGWSFQYVQDPGSDHKRIGKVILSGVATYGFAYDPTSRKVTAIKLPNPDSPNAEPGNPFTRTIAYSGTTGATVSEIYGGASSYAFDPALDAWSAVTDAAGLVTHHDLKSGWRLVEKIRAGSRYQESFTWDEKANRTGRSVQGGTSETWVYVSPADVPGSNLLQSHTLAGAGTTSYAYLTTADDPAQAGLLKSETNPCSETMRYTYGAVGSQSAKEFLIATEFIDPKANAASGRTWTVTARTAFGEPLTESSPSGTYTREYAWSDTGLLCAEKDLFGFATSFSYDLKDRRVLTTQPGGASSGQTYDALNRPTVARDVNGRTTETQYDGLGRVKKVIQKDENGVALIADLDYSYEVAGGGLRVTTKRGTRTLSIEQHDAIGRVTKSYAPLDENPTDTSLPPADLAAAEAAKLTTTFVYDNASGWLSQVKRWADDATELVTAFTHDDAGRVVQTAAPGGKVSKTVFHQAGWVAESHQPGHAPGATLMTRTEFDGCGRPETQFLPTAQTDTTGVAFVLTGYEYGQVKYRVDSKGKEESFEYTGDGLLAAHVDFDANRTEKDYLPAQNKIVTRLKRNGRANHETVTDLFDNRGLPDTSTSDLSGETDYVYGDDGLLASTTPPGFASPFTVHRDKLYRERGSSGPFGSSSVDYTEGPASLGDLTQATSARGLVQSFAVEPDTGAVFNVQDNQHAGVDLAKVLRRNKLGEVTANQDAAGLQWQRTPDYANRTVQTDRLDAADARWRKVTYTPSGLPEKAETQGLPGAAQFAYNALGQPTLTQDAAGYSATREYDELGRLTKVSAGERETSYVYEDAAPYGGRIKHIAVLGRGTTHYRYHADGLLKEIEDPKGYKTRFEFDDYGRLETIIYPDDQPGAPRREHFAYDALNRPFQKTDRAGRTHTSFYNDRNLVVRREIADGANVAKIHYTHDTDGTLLSEQLEGGGTYTWNYDKRGRPIQDGDCAYTYRPDNQVATKTHTPSSRTFSLGYVAAGKHKGLLETVQTPDGNAAFAYDDWGRTELLTLPGNVTRSFLRDSAGRVTSMTQIAGSLSETFAYARNGWGGLTNMTVTGANAYQRIWTYDPGGRLIGEERTGAGAYTNTFTYDANDNRESVTHDTGPVTIPRLWDFAGAKPPPELDTVEGAWTVSDGELIGTAEDGFGPPHALVPTGPGDNRAYSVALRVADDQEIRTTETRFAGLGLRAALAAGRYEVGLDVRRLADESLQRRLALRWVPDTGPAEVLAATSYVPYAGESLTLSAELDAANVLTAQFAQDATPGLTQTLTHGYNGELSLDVSGNRRPAIVQVSANPNPAYLGGGGETPPVIIQDEWPALIQAYFDNLAWSNTGPGTSTTRTYQYNAFNQLTRADDAQGWEEYLYDALGHLQERIDRKAPGNPTAITGRILYGHDALDRVTSVSVNPGLGAAGGEVLSAYTYLAATNKRASATVTPFGQPAQTTTYQWSGASLAGQTTGASTTWYGALGATPMWERTGATTYTYLEDGNQNVQAHWNATTGAIESQFAYDAYGKRSVVTGSAGTHASAPGYRGLLHDTDTKHGYFNARIKPEGEANFTDRDPIGMQGGLNQFTYCAGDPVNCWDPMGLYWEIKIVDGAITYNWIDEGDGYTPLAPDASIVAYAESYFENAFDDRVLKIYRGRSVGKHIRSTAAIAWSGATLDNLPIIQVGNALYSQKSPRFFEGSNLPEYSEDNVQPASIGEYVLYYQDVFFENSGLSSVSPSLRSSVTQVNQIASVYAIAPTDIPIIVALYEYGKSPQGVENLKKWGVPVATGIAGLVVFWKIAGPAVKETIKASIRAAIKRMGKAGKAIDEVVSGAAETFFHGSNRYRPAMDGPNLPDGPNPNASFDTSVLSRRGASTSGSEFRVARHGDMPSPRPNSQSHHGVMSAWMERNYTNYKPNKAPAVLMPTPKHRKTFGVYLTWRAEKRKAMGGNFDWAQITESEMIELSEKMFDAADVPQRIRKEYWEWYGSMIDALER